MTQAPEFSDLSGDLQDLCRAIWRLGPGASNLELSLALDWKMAAVSSRISDLVDLGRLLRGNRVGEGIHATGRELILLDAEGDAVRRNERCRRDTPKRRRCLGGCGRTFLSSWAGNRICDGCKERQARVSPLAPEVGL